VHWPPVEQLGLSKAQHETKAAQVCVTPFCPLHYDRAGVQQDRISGTVAGLLLTLVHPDMCNTTHAYVVTMPTFVTPVHRHPCSKGDTGSDQRLVPESRRCHLPFSSILPLIQNRWAPVSCTLHIHTPLPCQGSRCCAACCLAQACSMFSACIRTPLARLMQLLRGVACCGSRQTAPPLKYHPPSAS
jgi:hypothetical protein